MSDSETFSGREFDAFVSNHGYLAIVPDDSNERVARIYTDEIAAFRLFLDSQFPPTASEPCLKCKDSAEHLEKCLAIPHITGDGAGAKGDG